MQLVKEHKMFAGRQQVWRHDSAVTKTPMEFALFLPPQAEKKSVPVVTYLSGLTCSWANVTEKAGAQGMCAELGLAFLAPDTSPRGLDLPGEDESYDFGSGAGFYVDATEAPWDENYQMYSYVTKDLQRIISEKEQLDETRQGLMGHSMGGHGALTIALKNPDVFRSVSAFAPICSPMNCPWGETALTGYLGNDRDAWRADDACALLEDGHRCAELLVDQGEADEFLEEQLKPSLLQNACSAVGQPLQLRRQPGYDHSYYFMATFMEDHLRWHAAAL